MGKMALKFSESSPLPLEMQLTILTLHGHSSSKFSSCPISPAELYGTSPTQQRREFSPSRVEFYSLHTLFFSTRYPLKTECPWVFCPCFHAGLSATHSYRKVKWVTEFIFAQVSSFMLKKKFKAWLWMQALSLNNSVTQTNYLTFLSPTASLQKQDTTTSLSEAGSGCHEWRF